MLETLLISYSPDILVVTEAELDVHSTSSIFYQGYSAFFPPATKKVRVFMLVKSHIKVQHLVNRSVVDIPLLWCRFPEYKLLVGGLYRQFSSSGVCGAALESDQLDSIIALTQCVCEEQRSFSVVLLGDINLNMLKRLDKTYKRHGMLHRWLEELSALGLNWVQSSEITYKSHSVKDGKHFESVLDHIYTSTGLQAELHVLPDAISDHFPVQAQVQFCHGPERDTQCRLERVVVRNYEGINFEAMNTELEALGVSTWPCPPQGTPPDAVLDDVLSVLYPVLDKFAPGKEIRVRRNTPALRLRPETYKILRLRDHVRKTGKKKGQFKVLRNRAVSMVKKDRMLTAATTLQNAKNKQTAAWKLANNILKPKSDLPLLADTKSNEQSAAKLNNFYIDKVLKLRQSLPPPRKVSTSDLGKPIFSLHCVGMKQTRTAMKQLSSSRARGVDDIPASVWKNCPALVLPITRIINASISEAVVPEQWKTAVINPILKSGKSPSDEANWRPVAILPAASKILELVIRNQMLDFIEGQLPDAQHGFRRQRSVVTALIGSIHEWAELQSNGKDIGIIAWDFSSAFDTISKDTLINKMRELGMSNSTLDWITSYMSGGRQAVSWNGAISSFLFVEYGVRQGSILGPLFFIICTMSLPVALRGRIKLYADDTHGSREGKAENIPAALSSVCQRMASLAQELGLFLNVSKTQVMLTPKESFSSTDISPLPVAPTNQLELLGFKLNENLSPKPFVESLKTKLLQRLGLVRRLHAVLLPHVRQMYAAAVINGVMNTYASICFVVRLQDEDVQSTTAKEVQVIINDVGRAILGIRRRDHIRVRDILDRSGLEGLNRSVAKAAGMLAWHASSPSHTLNWVFSDLAGTAKTRFATENLLRLPKPKIAKKSIGVVNMVKIWNACGPLRVAKTVKEAKSALKTFARKIPM